MQLRKKEQPKLKPVSLRLPRDIYLSVSVEASKHDLSFNAAVNQILQTWYTASKTEKRKVKKK